MNIYIAQYPHIKMLKAHEKEKIELIEKAQNKRSKTKL